MKKLIVLSIIIAFACIATPTAFADDIFENTDLGAKIDAPNLIKFNDNHAIGAEISITDITQDWDLGSQAYIKYTYSGSLLDFSKK